MITPSVGFSLSQWNSYIDGYSRICTSGAASFLGTGHRERRILPIRDGLGNQTRGQEGKIAIEFTLFENIMIVLGIETSCDETGVAVYDSDRGLISHEVYTQAVHAEYGGVVPELASRDHIRKLPVLVKDVLEKSRTGLREIDGIAYTAGPGLAGALLVGTSVARSMAWALGKPAIAVHHMEAHLLVPMMEDPNLEFPFVCLLVSGGHTQLVHVSGVGRYQLLGQSIDDAAGEAFDKTAKILGLGYPGGPALARLAEQGTPNTYKFPRPMVDRPGCDFSFSGLKTFALNTWNDSGQTEQNKADIALAFQDAVVDTLLIKCKRALESTGVKTLVLAGGVSANQALREQLQVFGQEKGVRIAYPSPQYCTDNGAMIAYTGSLRLMAGESHSQNTYTVKPRWPMIELGPPA